jgi:hypothetical protein
LALPPMPPLRITPEGRIEGMPDPPPPGEQRVDVIMAEVDSAGRWKAADDGANDPAVISRTVWVRAEAGWLVDQVIPLLPPDVLFAGRIDEKTFAVGSPEFSGLTRLEVYRRVENLMERLTALMNIYSPNTRRHFEVWQVHERRTSGLGAAIKRFSVTTSHTDGIAKLAVSAKANLSRAAALLQLASSSKPVSEALYLLHAPDPGWGAVYDVLEFLKGSPVMRGKRRKIERYRRTANWYRHLGKPIRQPLPRNPPNLAQARTFASGLLEEWLELQLSRC